MRREGAGHEKTKTATFPVGNICRHANALKGAAGLRAQPCSPAVLRMAYATHAINPAAGIVRIQAVTMLAPTPHRNAESRREAPAPMTEPVTTWVVETGSPNWVANWITAAPVSCADMPVAGSSL